MRPQSAPDVAIAALAGHAHGMRHSASGLVHVTVRGRGGRERRAGTRVHRPLELPSDEITSLRGLPITTPARRLLDLSAAGIRNLDTLLDRAEGRIEGTISP